MNSCTEVDDIMAMKIIVRSYRKRNCATRSPTLARTSSKTADEAASTAQKEPSVEVIRATLKAPVSVIQMDSEIVSQVRA